jgi:hypothetical protein
VSKLSKLILMLSSNHDGEVVAAARAIERELTAEGHDWHWLTNKLNGISVIAEKPLLTEEVRVAICEIFFQRAHLPAKHHDFIESMFDRWMRYHDQAYVSEKQQKYVLDLYDQLKRKRKKQ